MLDMDAASEPVIQGIKTKKQCRLEPSDRRPTRRPSPDVSATCWARGRPLTSRCRRRRAVYARPSSTVKRRPPRLIRNVRQNGDNAPPPTFDFRDVADLVSGALYARRSARSTERRDDEQSMESLAGSHPRVLDRQGLAGRCRRQVVSRDLDRKSTRLNSSHFVPSRMPSSA